ncbi:MAG: adenosine deaminase [bacterium]
MSENNLIRKMPKAELHLHIEGSLEADMMFNLAKRNKIQLKFKTVDEIKKAYEFKNLQEFLDIYYEGAGVLINEEDFYDLTIAYISKAKQEKIVHAEIFFDPQTHMSRGVKFKTAITGIRNALEEGRKRYSVSSKIIMSFLRHMDELDAYRTLEEALPFKEWITAVGLDSSEIGHPPSKFRGVFQKAIKNGFFAVAHAGEEGPKEYITEAMELLNVSRIDHGNASSEDEALLKKLSERRIPLTLCPLSNLKLQVVKDLKKHPLKKFLDAGVVATINSDDPAYFGGYLNENYMAISDALDLKEEDILTLAKNSINASFISEREKETYIKSIKDSL